MNEFFVFNTPLQLMNYFCVKTERAANCENPQFNSFKYRNIIKQKNCFYKFKACAIFHSSLLTIYCDAPHRTGEGHETIR